MKRTLIALFCACLLNACSSTPTKVASIEKVPDYSFPVSIENLKQLVLLHAESMFQRDLKDRRLNPDEVSLRDYSYRYEGKTHPPLTYEVSRPWMAEREFGKASLDKSVEGPVDIVVDNAKRFLLFYRNVAYIGRRISEKESLLTVLNTDPFEKSIEEVKTKDGSIKDPLFFNSLILDLDHTLNQGKRNRLAEWEILKDIDPENAKTLGQQLGVEG